jgi:CBS domain-containing protein
VIAIDLISDEIPPLKDTDTGLRALNWMDEFKVGHLPVVSGTSYLGLVSDTDIMDLPDPGLQLKDQNIQFLKPCVHQNVHIYDVMKLISDLKLSLVPILDSEENYLGSTNVNYLMELIVNTASISETGAVIVLSMSKNDYSLSEISRIVEENDAKILSSYITSAQDSTEIEVTLKINQTDLRRILRSFERYEYDIKAHYQEDRFNEDIKDHYESLMNFIKM